MGKPIMSRAAVIEAARYVHLHGGNEVDLQALAANRGVASTCYYRRSETAPAHCKITVCVVGAFFWKHGLLDTPVYSDDSNGLRLGEVIARVGAIDNLTDIVEIDGLEGVDEIQRLHDDACDHEEDREQLREALGLGPA